MDAKAPAGSCMSEEAQSLLDAKYEEFEGLKRQNIFLKGQPDLAKLRNLLQEISLTLL